MCATNPANLEDTAQAVHWTASARMVHSVTESLVAATVRVAFMASIVSSAAREGSTESTVVCYVTV